MNPKNALFLSASLTAFVLSVLFGVVTKISNTTAQAATVEAVAVQATAVATLAPIPTLEQPTDLPVPTAQLPPTPDEAALLAATAINRQDVYSVEASTYKGTEAYKVVFSSGDIVYIGMDKLVLSKSKLVATVITVDPTQAPKKKNKGGGGGGNSQPASNPKPSSNESEGSDDHESQESEQDD